jgi:hypothetical protein
MLRGGVWKAADSTALHVEGRETLVKSIFRRATVLMRRRT